MQTMFGNRWWCLREVGEGGQAKTFEVEDTNRALEGRFVVKVIKSGNERPSRFARFQNEVRAIAAVSHPNVIRIIDSDLDGDDPFYVAPFYAGGNMEVAKPFDHRDVSGLFDLFGQICDGVAAAHAKAIIHRDLKPQNILLDGDSSGDAVVADFGICLITNQPRLTSTNERVGPRDFMAPELEFGRLELEAADARCDIYSLGKLLYWLLSGGRVLPREHYRRSELDLKQINPFFEHVNSKLLDHMIREDASERFESIASFRSELPGIRDAVVNEYNSLEPNFPSRCLFCGVGIYQHLQERQYRAIRGQGYVNPDYWRFLRCRSCGNVQQFRVWAEGEPFEP